MQGSGTFTPIFAPEFSHQGTPMRYNSKGFTLIELLIVVVIIGLLVAIAVPKFANGKERAIVTSMRGDLHNLLAAQEGYFSNANTYYSGPLPGALPYNTSPGVSVTLSGVTAAGWGATATHFATGRVCAIFVGNSAPPAPATVEGQIACTP
jgi:type IV pilus assembly protein PilA